jgi:DHA2 family multidrug resistance protein
MFSLVRNVGQGVGISIVTTVLAQMQMVNYSELTARLTLDSAPLRDFATAHGGFENVVGSLNGMISQQAAMLGFLDDFKLRMIVTLVSMPIVFLLRPAKGPVKVDPAHAMAD